MEIHLIRHTTVELEKGICYGQSDVGLAATFFAESTQIQSKLDGEYDCVFSSSLIRCTQLAEQLNLGKIQTDDRLKEINFGKWELKAWNAIDQKEIALWHDSIVGYKLHGGESLFDLQQRVHAFINDLKNNDYKKVLIVSHAGVLRLFYQYILDFPLQNTMKYPIQFGQVHKMHLSQDPSLCWIQSIK